MPSSLKQRSVGDLVWAKMRGHPPWPATITSCPPKVTVNNKYGVLFFGTRETAQIKSTDLYDYLDHRKSYELPRKIKGFNEGVREIRCAAGLPEDPDEEEEEPSEEPSQRESNNDSPTITIIKEEPSSPTTHRTRKPSSRISTSEFIIPTTTVTIRSRNSSLMLSHTDSSPTQSQQSYRTKSPLTTPNMLKVSNTRKTKARTNSTCSNGNSKRTKRVSYSDKFGLDFLDYDSMLSSESDPLVAMNACLGSNPLFDEHSDDEKPIPRKSRRRTRSRLLEDFMASPSKSPRLERDRSRSISTIGGRSRLTSGLSGCDFDDLLESVHSIFNPSELMAAIDQLPSGEESDRPMTPEEPLPMPVPIKTCYSCQCQCELIGLKWRCTSKACLKWNGVHQPFSVTESSTSQMAQQSLNSNMLSTQLADAEIESAMSIIKKEANLDSQDFTSLSNSQFHLPDELNESTITKFQPARYQEQSQNRIQNFNYEQKSFATPGYGIVRTEVQQRRSGRPKFYKVEKTPPVEANGMRLCVFCNGQVRPQMCGGNKHRWRCVDKKCRKWYGWVKVHDEIPKDLGKKGRWKDLVLKVQGHSDGMERVLTDEKSNEMSRNLSNYLASNNSSSLLLNESRLMGVNLFQANPDMDRINIRSDIPRPKRRYQRRRKPEEPEVQRPLSPLTLRQQSYEPSSMERRGRWWLSDRTGVSNLFRDQPVSDDPGAAITKAAAAMRILGNAMCSAASTRADEPGSINGSLDLLMDSFIASLAPILSLVAKVPELDVEESTLNTLWNASAVHTPLFQ
ncbi:PWWP domain-containing protein [Ditylenchus destructor]|nr:PWWP domain-containing protein [Ditylenchus destructor]